MEVTTILLKLGNFDTWNSSLSSNDLIIKRLFKIALKKNLFELAYVWKCFDFGVRLSSENLAS